MSDRKLPLLMRQTSTCSVFNTMSHTKLPAVVSLVRTLQKRQSRSLPSVPMTRDMLR